MMRCPICNSKNTEDFEVELTADDFPSRHWSCNDCESDWWESGQINWDEYGELSPIWDCKPIEINPNERGEIILAEKLHDERMKQAQAITIRMF